MVRKRIREQEIYRFEEVQKLNEMRKEEMLKAVTKENCNKLLTLLFRERERRCLFEDDVSLEKEPTKIYNEKLFYLSDILETQPIE